MKSKNSWYEFEYLPHHYGLLKAPLLREKTLKKKKCLLGSCDEMTENGYCCARHCEIDKESGKDLPNGKKKLSRKQRKIIKGQKQ